MPAAAEGNSDEGQAAPGSGDGVSSHQQCAEQLLQEPAQREAVLALAAALERPRPEAEAALEETRGLYDDTLALIRYLRARNWDVQRAEQMIRSTARWRKEFDFHGLLSGNYSVELARENESGKMYVRGYDRKGRPAVYMKPRNEHSTDGKANVKHLVYCIERAIACLEQQAKRGQLEVDESNPTGRAFVLMVDFGGVSINNAVSIGTAREVIMILQDHYPERLGEAFMVDVPWFMSGFLSAVTSFADPVTAKKFHFVCEVGEARSQYFARSFDLNTLEPVFGGVAEEPFKSHIFLNTKLNDTEYGLEYEEQLQLAGYFPSPKNQPQEEISAVQQARFWTICSDPQVLWLSREERNAVRALARKLASSTIDEVECGLYDDAGTMIRYLQARKWDVAQAEKAMRATVQWRKDFDWLGLRQGKYTDAIAHESSLSRLYVRGYDLRGRTIVYVKFTHYRDTGKHEDILRYIVYCVERAIAASEDPEASPTAANDDAAGSRGRITLIVDFAGYRSSKRPRLRTLKAAAKILQEHYPERLGEAYVFNAPLKVRAFWSIVRRFVDPNTANKVMLVDYWQCGRVVDYLFSRDTLESCLGGRNTIPFDPSIFLTESVNGDIYGVEFDAQQANVLAAATQRPRVVRFSDHANSMRPSEVKIPKLPLQSQPESSGWSLSSLIGGGWLW